MVFVPDDRWNDAYKIDDFQLSSFYVPLNILFDFIEFLYVTYDDDNDPVTWTVTDDIQDQSIVKS